MIVKQSFDTRFVKKLKDINDKYGENMLEADGIGQNSLDINHFSNNFLKSAQITDVTVDTNANCDDSSVVAFDSEFVKSISRLNSYYLMWKKIQKTHGIRHANKTLEMCVNGNLKLHDLHAWLKPYSYYQETPIIIRVNGASPHIVTMKHLFATYKEFTQYIGDAQVIDARGVHKNLQFKSSNNVKHKDNLNGLVKINHNIEVLDSDNEWVKITQVLRHQSKNDMIMLETTDGDFTLVTDDHPVILSDFSEKLARDIVVDDNIAQEKLQLAQFNNQISVNTDIAYLIGFLLGDGNVSRREVIGNTQNLTEDDLCIKYKAEQNGCTIYQKNIKDTKIYNIIVKHFPNTISRQKNSGIKCDGSRMTFNNLDFKYLLSNYFNLDYQSYSYMKMLPTNILSWDNESKKSLIAGLLDAEGEVDKFSGLIDIRMTSFSIISALSEVCQSIGYKCKKRVCRKNMSNFYGIVIYPNDSEIYKYSTKAQHKNIGHCNKFDKFKFDKRNGKIKKITRITQNDENFKPYNSDESCLKWVYDITTTSGHFYASGMIQHNCYGFSLDRLVSDGMPFIARPHIKKPQRFKSFINLVIQFVAFSSNQLAGAIALPDLFVYMDWYLRKEYGEEYILKPDVQIILKEEIQSLVYSLNFPWRSSQSAFTNFSLFDETKVQTLTFPVNTVMLYKDDDGNLPDEHWVTLTSELNCINGSFNIFSGPLGRVSSCCRLTSDTTKLKEYTNSFGAGGVSIGSHRVVTLNMPRIAFESSSVDEFLKHVEDRVGVAQDILCVHRNTLSELIESRKLPLYTYGFMSLEKQFSTVGFIGLNEAIEILGMDITNNEGSNFAARILNLINKLNDNRTKIDGHIRNLEQIPGEGAAISCATKDKLLYSASPYDIYSNQYIPLSKEVDLHDRIILAGKFDELTGGGAICHLNITDSISPEQMKELIKYSAKKGCIYFAINVAQCRCNLCGKLHIGKYEKSPCCNSNVEKYLRIVGFLVPVSAWSEGRKTEYKQRQFYISDVV